MNYDSLETEIVDVLKSYFAGVPRTNPADGSLDTLFIVRRIPDNPAELVQEYDKALVNVAYSGSTYGPARSAPVIVQEETISLSLVFQCNTMKGEGGGWQFVTHCKKALLGYKPTEAIDKLVLSAYGDWEPKQGELQPALIFSCMALNTQAMDTPDAGTIDSEGTIANGGNLVVVDSELYE